jgi:hypothetical protein
VLAHWVAGSHGAHVTRSIAARTENAKADELRFVFSVQ